MSISLPMMQIALASLSGLSIGYTLGLVGGGAGLLAVPLLLYFVKVGDAHVAVGTTAASIALTALFNLASYARAGLVRWRVASLFAATGVGGALAGSRLSLAVDGHALTLLLAAIVAIVALLMIKRSLAQAQPLGIEGSSPAPSGFATAGAGLAVGGVAGFFGVSGGFLSVPALNIIARIPMLEAVASSLVSVVVFGTTTAISYGLAGKVDLSLALALVAGGIVGGPVGIRSARLLAGRRTLMNRVFATMLLLIAAVIAYRGMTHG